MNPSTATLWEEIKAAYRRSCDCARERDEAASARILQEEVLPRFSQWARLTGCGEDNRRLFIENLIRQERRRVQSAWVRHHLEARNRRLDLENAIKQERRDLQREWAIQTDIGRRFAEFAVNLPAPIEWSDSQERARANPDRAGAPPIDDLANVIDFALREQGTGADHPAPATAVA